MSTGNLAPAIRQQWFNGGVPLSGGQLFSYQAGTTTPQATYTDQTMGTPNTNPVVLDANGQANVWLDPTLAYKFVLEDALNNVLWTVDQVVGLLGNLSVPTAALQAGAVTTAKLAANSVTSAILASDSSIDTNRAVQTNHIRLAAVTAAKLAQSAIGLNGIYNLGLTASVASSALTITMTDTFGATPSVSSPVSILFRDESASAALPQFDLVTAALSITIPSGASLGQFLTNTNKDIWIYAVDNSGTVVLAVSGSRSFDETTLQSTTTISSGSTNINTLYSTSGLAGPVRLIGKLTSNQATAGTYNTAPGVVALYTSDMSRQQSELYLAASAGYGATSTMVRCFTGILGSLTGGYDTSYIAGATLGDMITINTADYYSISYWDNFSSSGQLGITKNDNSGGTTSIASTNQGLILATASTTAANQVACCSVRTFLNANDVIRAKTSGVSSGSTANGIGFRIIRG